MMRVVTIPLLGAVLALASAVDAAEVGDRAPNCSLVPIGTAQHGIELSDYAGRVVWLDFWASWCGDCTESFPVFDRIQRELGDRGLVVIGVSLDVERERAEAFLAQHPVGFLQTFDPRIGDCARAFDVAGMPTSFVVDAGGVVRRVHRGFRRGEIEATRDMVSDLLARSGAPGASAR
jgi:thiol-disulfide isomerase/thioredoxin